jgi:dihydroorotate dehydrogenase electron transfer subunit
MLASQILGSRLGILGPLGRGIDHELSFGKKIVVVADGLGYATVLSMLSQMKKRGIVDPLLFYGVRSDLEAIRQGPYSPRYVSLDGSIGVKGTVSDILRNQLDELKKSDLFIVSVSSATAREISQIFPRDKSYYFLERPMACGFGVCGSCRVRLIDESGSVRHGASCVEGPFFRGDRMELSEKEFS